MKAMNEQEEWALRLLEWWREITEIPQFEEKFKPELDAFHYSAQAYERKYGETHNRSISYIHMREMSGFA